MNKRKFRIHIPKIHLPWYLGAGEILLFTCCITLLVLCCQPNSIVYVAKKFLSEPLLIPLNLLPIGILVVCFSFLMGNVAYGAAIVNLVAVTMSIINRMKIQLRDEGLYPRDFLMFREAGDILTEYNLAYPVKLIVLMVGTTALLVLAGLVFKNRKAGRGISVREALVRLGGTAGSFGLLVTLIFTLFASYSLYTTFSVTSISYKPNYFNQLGFPYYFCYQFTANAVEKPDGYSKSQVESWEEGTTTGLGTDVHVIMVMNESFSDITDASVFDYAEEEDPLFNLHALQNSDQAITGYIVVPCFGAGTASTEFDVLTGMQDRSLGGGPYDAFRFIFRNTESIYRLLNADGFTSSYIHPGKTWCYNRENVLAWLGAQSTLFVKDMENVQYKGTWVTDSYVASLIESAFEDAVASGQHLFNYTTTIQNHQSYTATKYKTDSTGETVQLNVEASEETIEHLSSYVEGVRDADTMLGELVEYFNSTDEPVLLVFFGDHLPSLKSSYQELGLTRYLAEVEGEDPFSAYETPFVIYANDAAAEALDWYNLELDLPENSTISASYLGALVVEIMGKSDESPWYTFLNELRREIPVSQAGTYMLADGTYTTQLSQELQTLMDQWLCWTYYRLNEGIGG